MNEWYVLSEGQQLGPYTDEQLVQFAQEGRIAADTMVWAEGMAEWAPASEVPGLIAPAPVPVAKSVTSAAWAPPGARAVTATTSPISTSPYAAPASSLVAAAPVGGDYPFLSIKAANFALWMWTLLASILSFILMIVFFVKGGHTASTAAAGDTAAMAPMMLGFAMYGLCLLCMVLSMIFFYMNIYRAWSCLSAGAPCTTPGKAIGMLFVPFYNLYWMFVAISGLPKDWNRIMASYEDLKTAPRLNEMMFLLFCIGSLVFPPLALVIMFPMMSQLCKGINFFAYRRNPKAPGTLGAPGFGGIRFG